MDKEQIDRLAESIARVVAADTKPADLSSLQKSIQLINERLDRLEAARPAAGAAANAFSKVHPSQDRFAIAEAIVDSLFERETKEKACTFEPNGKPCDHCSMCSSRGF